MGVSIWPVWGGEDAPRFLHWKVGLVRPSFVRRMSHGNKRYYFSAASEDEAVDATSLEEALYLLEVMLQVKITLDLHPIAPPSRCRRLPPFNTSVLRFPRTNL